MKKISIIIVTYNSIALIKDCIDSVFQFNDIQSEAIEVIVVDNSDEIASVQLFEYLKNLYRDKVILIKNSKNLGYGQGNNTGIIAATGDLICIMNPDVRFVEPLLRTVQNNFESNDNLSLLGFKQLGGKNLSYYLKPECGYGILTSIIIKLANKLEVFNKNKFYLSGAFMFLDKDKFDGIGKFDENIFMYFEEADITNRLNARNYDIQFDQTKVYLHLMGERKEISNATFEMQKTSQDYYLDKYKIDKEKYYRTLKNEYRFKLILASLTRDYLKKRSLYKELIFLNEHKNLL